MSEHLGDSPRYDEAKGVITGPLGENIPYALTNSGAEVELLRGLLREAADLIGQDHQHICTCEVNCPCPYEQLRRRIEEALNG